MAENSTMVGADPWEVSVVGCESMPTTDLDARVTAIERERTDALAAVERQRAARKLTSRVTVEFKRSGEPVARETYEVKSDAALTEHAGRRLAQLKADSMQVAQYAPAVGGKLAIPR